MGESGALFYCTHYIAIQIVHFCRFCIFQSARILYVVYFVSYKVVICISAVLHLVFLHFATGRGVGEIDDFH